MGETRGVLTIFRPFSPKIFLPFRTSRLGGAQPRPVRCLGHAWATPGPWVGHGWATSGQRLPASHALATRGMGAATGTILLRGMRVGHDWAPPVRRMGAGQAACMPRVVGAGRA